MSTVFSDGSHRVYIVGRSVHERSQIQGEAKFRIWDNPTFQDLLILKSIPHPNSVDYSAGFAFKAHRNNDRILFFRHYWAHHFWKSQQFSNPPSWISKTRIVKILDDFEIIVTGTMADIIEGEDYTFWGNLVQHPKQFVGQQN